jgi:hypothetical protein
LSRPGAKGSLVREAARARRDGLEVGKREGKRKKAKGKTD